LRIGLKKGNGDYCFKLFPDCVEEKGKALKPSRRCYSLVDRDFSIRVHDKPSGYAVKDPVTGKWISYLQRKTKDVPLFPFLLEFSKKIQKEREQVVTVFLLKTACGYVRIKITPNLPEISKKVTVARLRPGGNRIQKFDLSKIFQIREITDSFGRKPYFVITNLPELKKLLIEDISRVPRPEEANRKLLEVAEQNVLVKENPLLYALTEVRGSSEIYVTRELPVKQIGTLVLAGLLVLGGIDLYLKKKEEEKRLAELRRKQMMEQNLKLLQNYLQLT